MEKKDFGQIKIHRLRGSIDIKNKSNDNHDMEDLTQTLLKTAKIFVLVFVYAIYLYILNILL